MACSGPCLQSPLGRPGVRSWPVSDHPPTVASGPSGLRSRSARPFPGHLRPRFRGSERCSPAWYGPGAAGRPADSSFSGRLSWPCCAAANESRILQDPTRSARPTLLLSSRTGAWTDAVIGSSGSGTNTRPLGRVSLFRSAGPFPASIDCDGHRQMIPVPYPGSPNGANFSTDDFRSRPPWRFRSRGAGPTRSIRRRR